MDSSPLPRRYIDMASRPGSEARVREGLVRKLARIAVDNPVVNLAREAYRYLADRRLPARYKVMVIAALLYFLAPIDTVPDAIPGVGYVDDVLVLSAVVASVRKLIEMARDSAREVIRGAEEASERVVSHTLSEARESWARRGVAQFALFLWGSTTAAFVGLIYYGTRRLVLDAGNWGVTDPFSWAVVIAASLGFLYNFLLLLRVWKRYSGLPPEVREPLAYALVSLLDWRQAWVLFWPVFALMVILAVRFMLGAFG